MIWQPVVLTIALLQGQGLLADIPAKYNKPAPTADKVVARVNGVEIKAGDVENLLWQSRGAEATNDLILYLQVKQDAQKKGVTVTDAEVEEAVAEQLTQAASRIQPGDTVENYLARQGFSPSRLYLRSKMEITIQKILGKEVKPEDYVKVSTLIVRPASQSSSDLQDALKRANDLYARLKKGESWDSVLRSTTSTDVNAARTGGLLGWRELNAFPDPAKKEMATLKTGGFTAPVQTQFGIQIFRVEAKGANAGKQDLAELHKQYMQARMAQYLTDLEKGSKVERLLPGS